MGVVYEAQDTRLPRSVAIKVLKPALSRGRRRDPALQARGAARLVAESPEHLHDSRRSDEGDAVVHRDGAARGHEPQGAPRRRGRCRSTRSSTSPARSPTRWRRARPGHHPPRHHAGQHLSDRQRTREAARLRPREALSRRRAATTSTTDDLTSPAAPCRHDPLHGAGTVRDGRRRSTTAATCSRSAPCSIRWPPARGRSTCRRGSALIAAIQDAAARPASAARAAAPGRSSSASSTGCSPSDADDRYQSARRAARRARAVRRRRRRADRRRPATSRRPSVAVLPFDDRRRAATRRRGTSATASPTTSAAG